ncbi:patatin-like phospholipase family protein [Aeromonas veronii]
MKKGISFSGGGYRATLFAIGSLIRLNEEGLLKRLDTYTSVSGGAIAIGYLSLIWDKLEFVPLKKNQDLFIAINFFEIFVTPLMIFCEKDIDTRSIIKGILRLQRPCYELEKYYDKYLFKNAKLCQITQDREFIFYGTNYDTGVSVRLSRDSIRDYQLGTATHHDIKLSEAIAISSAFPPLMSPFIIKNHKMQWNDSPYSQIKDEETLAYLRSNMRLADGGLYDNLGIEALWKVGEQQEYDTVFVADAGAPFTIPQTKGKILRIFENFCLSQYYRMTNIMIQQQRALRKRWLIHNFKEPGRYKGVYWGIETDINNYDNEHILKPESRQRHLSQCKYLKTKLSPFKSHKNIDVCNYAYALCDAALLYHHGYRTSEPKFPF